MKHKPGHAAARVGGKVASIDGRAKLAVLSLAGANGKLLALDLSRAKVHVRTKRGVLKTARLKDVRMRDRVLVKLKVSAKVARADALRGVSAPVDDVLDQRPEGQQPADGSQTAAISGLVQVVAGGQVVLALGGDAGGTTVTLDLSGAQVYAGHPPVAADAGSIATGDRVLANLGVSYQTLKADIQAGTAVPVTTLFDLGVPPTENGGGDSQTAVIGGAITGIVGDQVTITFGDGDNPHTAILDISSASLFAGAHAATATPIDATALHVGDRVYALLSVSEDVAHGDVQSGTPLPVTKLYDAGTPSPKPPEPPESAALGGHITVLGSGQVTIGFGDGSNAHTAILDISSAALFAFAHDSSTPITADALQVGDRVYALLSVSTDVAQGDVQSGTPIPVSKLYDAGPVTTPPPTPPAPPPPPAIVGGRITALGSGQVTISFGDAPNVHTAVLDISSASLFSGLHASTATPIDAGALQVGDRVYAVTSVTSDVAQADIQAGTAIPVSKLYDGGPPS